MDKNTGQRIIEIRPTDAPFVPIFHYGQGVEQDSLVTVADDGTISVTIDNPWSGPSGHGTKSTIIVPPDVAVELGVWLIRASGNLWPSLGPARCRVPLRTEVG